MRELEELQVDELAFSSYEVENLRPVPLLVQTGYLTIKGYDPESRLYTLSYPNFEVENAFLRHLLSAFSGAENGVLGGTLWQLSTALREREWERFFAFLQGFFAAIPYDIQLSQERYYQTVCYLIFKLLGLPLGMEGGVPISHSPISHLPAGLGLQVGLPLGMEGGVPISHSPISHLPAGLGLQVGLPLGMEGGVPISHSPILPFSWRGSGVGGAERGYVEPYRQGGKPIYAIGVVFGREERGLVDWQVVETA